MVGRDTCAGCGEEVTGGTAGAIGGGLVAGLAVARAWDAVAV